MLCSLTLYKGLKKKFPDARITLVAAKTNYEIPFFDINPFIDRVIVFDKSSLSSIIHFIKLLRSRKYEIGIVPSTIVLSRTSHILNFISGAKLKVGVNSIDKLQNPLSKLLNIKTDFLWSGVHQSIRNLQIINQIGCDLSEEEIKSIKINLSEYDYSFADKFIKKNFTDCSKMIIAFHPGAGKSDNRWDKENFVSLIKKIYDSFQSNILITSGWTDGEIISSISSSLRESDIKFAILHNASIKKLAAVLSIIDLYITNDTGTMHIAGYVNTKMISLFGPTNPNEWAPTGINHNFIKSPTDKINDISIQQVFSLVCQILTQKKDQV
ncbi:MAG: glycosyltransferase family 9 protein [Ignavibacterium sp.]|jgi:ADP-heptose:LPS heptosyltransferase|nr:glycosyltransferase family 9 protein [Ignavibacterium sp.]